MHGDVATRAQPHLDAVFDGVPPGDVLEVVDVEALGVEFGPQHLDEVAVELGGDPGTVVVGRDETRRRLDQVGAEEEVIAGGEGRPRSGQKRVPLPVVEVADGAAQEDHQPLARPAGQGRRTAR